MAQTTLICDAGLLVFVPCSFLPASQFALLMFSLLLVALVGDLILLPALLVSPLGRARVKGRSTTTNEEK